MRRTIILSLPTILLVGPIPVEPNNVPMNNLTNLQYLDTELHINDITYGLFAVIYFNNTHFNVRMYVKNDNSTSSSKCIYDYDSMKRDGLLSPVDVQNSTDKSSFSMTLNNNYKAHYAVYLKQ